MNPDNWAISVKAAHGGNGWGAAADIQVCVVAATHPRKERTCDVRFLGKDWQKPSGGNGGPPSHNGGPKHDDDPCERRLKKHHHKKHHHKKHHHCH